MRVVFLAENYHRFYDRFGAAHPELAGLDYDAVQQRMFEEFFYQADSHAAALRKLGHEAFTIIPDCIPLQRQWAREHGLWMPPYRKRVPGLVEEGWRLATGCGYREAWHARVLAAQLAHYRPDVVQVFSGVRMTGPMLKRLRGHARKWICQWACPIREAYPYEAYDLILTTAENFVEEFTRRGFACRKIQHAFDERIEPHLESVPPGTGVVFVGSLTPHHVERTVLLEAVAREVPLDAYGEGFDALPPESALRAAWRGGAKFGLEMYRLYARHGIALHVPGEVGRAFAGAKRLFEITGAGCLLLAAAQPGLDEYFVVGQEIDVFRDAAEAVRKIRRYLEDEPLRRALAAAGKQRTLRDHVYGVRMKEWLHAVA